MTTDANPNPLPQHNTITRPERRTSNARPCGGSCACAGSGSSDQKARRCFSRRTRSATPRVRSANETYLSRRSSSRARTRYKRHDVASRRYVCCVFRADLLWSCLELVCCVLRADRLWSRSKTGIADPRVIRKQLRTWVLVYSLDPIRTCPLTTKHH